MDKDEVIILSSDEEGNSLNENKPQPKNTSSKIIPQLKSAGVQRGKIISDAFGNVELKYLKKMINKRNTIGHSYIPLKRNKYHEKSPEVVDLVENIDKPTEEDISSQNENFDNKTDDKLKNHEIKKMKSEALIKDKSKITLLVKEKDKNIRTDKQTNKLKKNNITNREKCDAVKTTVHNHLEDRANDTIKSKIEVSNNCVKDVNENKSEGLPEFYKEFLDSCASFESNLTDQMRMIEKLRKRYTEADTEYVTSEEFKSLIEISKNNLNLSNLYAVAKAVTDQLKWWKKETANMPNNESNQSFEKGTEQCIRRSEKQVRMINKIIKKLDKLGKRIQEIEEAEVEWSDEENSSYVQLQRYRERYCQIYQKLCKYTNEVSDANRVYCRKISFTGSKYQPINKCIEKWLNKTKRFPDFSDIMKLLESQSSTLGLPNNRESIRILATEIFQQVGQMLQLRRKYDLWDSYCGFLDNSEDPARNDPSLDKTLRENFENRLKKEQEIINYFAELQEKERLEPEEVPEDEASNSPAESGSEDEKEIEEVEKTIHERLDTAIEMEQVLDDVKENGGYLEDQDFENVSSDEDCVRRDKENNIMQTKESKNNFKNCKSLKWRGDKSLKSKEETNSENSNFENQEGRTEDVARDVDEDDEVHEIVKDDSDLELIGSQSPAATEKEEKCSNQAQKALKRMVNVSEPQPIKKLCLTAQRKEIKKAIIEIDTKKNCKKVEEIIDIRYCQLEQNFNAIADKRNFYNFSEKQNWGKEKVFRDLTNINGLLRLKGKKRMSMGLFSQALYSYELDRFSRKRFSFGYNLVTLKNQKCALSHDEKSMKNINSKGGEGGERSNENNSVEGGDELNCFGGHGSGSEGDNNENDENEKRKAKSGNDSDDNKEEEENDEENEDEESDEAVIHSAGATLSHSREIFVETERGEKNIEDGIKNKVVKVLDEPTINESKKCKDDPNEKMVECRNENDGKCEDADKQRGNSVDHTDEKEVNGMNVKSENEKDNNSLKNAEFSEKTNNEKKTTLEETRTLSEKEAKNKNIGEAEETIEDSKNSSVAKEKMIGKKQEGIEKETLEEHLAQKDEKNVIEKTVDLDKARHEEVGSVNKKDADVRENKKESSQRNDKDTSILSKEIVENNQDVQNDSESTIREPNKDSLGTDILPNSEESDSSNLPQSKSKNDSFSDGIIEVEVELHEEEDYFKHKNTMIKGKTPCKRPESAKVFTSPTRKLQNVDSIVQNIRRRTNTPSKSDEERVKQFLLHSPSSISITPPKKLSLSKPPSQAALQALATLRGLKGISTTRVTGKRKPEDEVVVIGESQSRQNNQSFPKCRRNQLPIITNVQSVKATPTPKIVTVQGNASGFTNVRYSRLDSEQQTSNPALRISNVWGGLSDTFYQSMQDNEPVLPSCSSRQSYPSSQPSTRKKSSKKTVEYVVLE